MEKMESGFQEIGGLTRKIERSLSSLESTTQDSPQSNSATTGQRKPARTQPLSIGTQSGGHGVATKSSGPPSVWRTDQNLLASLPEPLRNSLRSKARYDSDFENTLGYDSLEPKNDEGREMVSAALRTLDKSLEPAPKASIIKALVRLRLSTNSRNQDSADAKVQNAIYAEELAEFPGDVVEEALRKLARLEDWFPPISKIRDQCQRLVQWRRVTQQALARAI